MFDLMPFGNRNERRLWNELMEMDKNFFGDVGSGMKSFRTDIEDKGDSYELTAELPGFSKEEIKINVEGDYLTVSAEHNEEKEEKNKKGQFIRRERKYGSFSRGFYVGDIKKDQINAAYQDGVLTLTLPKKVEGADGPKQIEIH